MTLTMADEPDEALANRDAALEAVGPEAQKYEVNRAVEGLSQYQIISRTFRNSKDKKKSGMKLFEHLVRYTKRQHDPKQGRLKPGDY